MDHITPWHRKTGITAVRIPVSKDQNEEQWLAERAKGIGGSDIAAIAGLNPWKSPIDVWLEKTGRAPKQRENEKMRWGTVLETAIAEEYATRSSCPIERCNAMLAHAEFPHHRANLDRVIFPTTSADIDPASSDPALSRPGILEIKNTGYAQAWDEGAIPQLYACQGYWYMHVTGLPYTKFAALASGQTLLTPAPLLAHPETQAALAEVANRFWFDHVQADKPPTPRTPADTDSMVNLFPNMEDKAIDLPKDLAPLLAQRAALVDTLKRAEETKKEIDGQLLYAIGKARYGFLDAYKVTRVLKTNVSLDSKSLREAYPEIAQKFTRTSQSAYVLVTVPKKKG